MELDPVRTRKAIERLHANNADLFGANGHRFALNLPLAESDAIAFERKYRIKLPAEYRHFITRIANGGAGPFYGIFPLGKMDKNDGEEGWEELDGLVGILSRPFPLRDSWNDLKEMPQDELRDADDVEYERQYDRFERAYWDSSLVNGAIPICHQGCALRIWLVVTGDAAGTLWDDRRAEYRGLLPLLLRDRTRATFSTWYQEWLDEAALRHLIQ